MLLDKTLVLKGVAGVAALGGVVGGGFAAQSAGLFSYSSKPATDNQQSTLQSSNDQATGALTPDSPKSTEDSQGIPNRCNTSGPCELTEEELKKIKFEVLGDDETTDVTVEGFPTGDQKLTLTIDSTDTNKKKYIFSNGSSNPVKIKRSEDKTVTLAAGKTKFTLSSDKLKQFTLNDYGLPSDCESTCTLTSTDLEDIKFEDLGTEAGTVTVTPKKKVTLTIGTTPKRYKFNNSGSQITITKGSGNTAKTVTLNTGVTEYKENSGVLRYVEPTDDYGVPKRCNTSSPCDLSEENLKNIKFETLEEAGVTGDVEVESYPSAADQKITLTIDSTDSTKKKYIFSNGSSENVTIKRGETKSVTLKASGRTKFTLSSDKLKQFELGNYGLPSGCESTSPCTLTYTDLEDIKFDGLEGTLTIEPKNQKVSLTIDSSSSDHKRYLFTSSSSVTVNGSTGSSGPITLDSSKTRFKGNSGNLKKIELDDKGIPTDCINSTCTLTADDLKYVKFPGFDTATGTVTVSPNNQTVSLTINSGKKEYSFNNSSSSAITITKGNASVELAKEGPTVFYEEDNKLVKTTAIEKLNEMLKKAGFPVEDNCVNNNCCKLEENKTSVECKLTKNKFLKLKFNNLGDDGMVDSQITINEGSPITAKIEKEGTGVKITFSDITSASMSIDKKNGGSSTFYLKNNDVCTIDSQNRIVKKNAT